MTENQQKIIDSLKYEFSKLNKIEQANSNFSLINVAELDEINNLHIRLTDDALATKRVWEARRDEYINELINKLRDDLKCRLIVNRGDVATDNKNYSNSVFIYRQGTNKTLLISEAFRFNVDFLFEQVLNSTTNRYYTYYTGMVIKRYVSPNSEKNYNDEYEFFNCEYTKGNIRSLLNNQNKK